MSLGLIKQCQIVNAQKRDEVRKGKEKWQKEKEKPKMIEVAGNKKGENTHKSAASRDLVTKVERLEKSKEGSSKKWCKAT